MDYLTEEELCECFKKASYGDNFITQYKLGRGRVDGVVLNKEFIVMGVEFDGSFHYTSTRQILADRERNLEFLKKGARLLRWPYWLQPSQEICEYFCCPEIFKFVGNSKNYKQGFISTERSCVLPADFCTYGFERFISEFSELPLQIKLEIAENLDERAVKDVVARESLILIRARVSLS